LVNFLAALGMLICCNTLARACIGTWKKQHVFATRAMVEPWSNQHSLNTFDHAPLSHTHILEPAS
jgi:hypothetical protein